VTDGTLARPQAAKLGLKPGQRVELCDPPPGWALADPPAGLLDAEPDGPADLIIAFFTAAGEIAERLDGLARRVYPAGAVWAAWPRRAGGHRSDITDEVIREHALPIGLVDVKVAAIDQDWSGLRLVWRRENRLPWVTWVSIDAESPRCPRWPSGSRSRWPTSLPTASRARRCRSSGMTSG
jgi:hypothetical protein